MQVATNTVVTVAFTLKDKDGKLVEQADEKDPLVYLHGHGSLPPGFENTLNGMSPGETRDVHLEPADAFGPRDETRIEKVGRHRLGKKTRFQKGDVLRLEGEDGPMEATVVAVTQVSVTLDFNHPLAGQALDCSFKLLEVREATAEERDHGHAHGDGHHHH